ncbi:MAG: hypothetical protein FJY65_09600, partial [Calditrichaeota bacterium]|nr:hypothetical protein [Calditrichota bacterium]
MKGRIFGLILLIGAACVSSVDAQPDSLWSRTYGGTANDTLAGLIPTADGGYLLCGYFTLLYETDIDGYLLKLDSQFNRQWEDYFGGRQAQIIRDIHQLPDGGYIAAGYTESDPIDNVRRAWVRRLDDEGRGVWTEYLGRTNYSDAFSVVPNPDGTFVVGGTFYPGNGWQDDFALWKLNAQGGQVWRRHFGDSAAGEFGLSLVRCEDGGYALGGQRLVWGESGVEDGSAMFLRADNDGEQLWRNNYGDRDGIEFFIRVIITSDGGFLCVGGYGDKSGGQGIHNFDGFLVKADADGRQQWAQRLDLGGRWEFVFDVLEVNDGYVVTGVTGSPSENNWEGLDSCDAYLLRTDLRGNIRWQRIFAGPGHDYGYRILLTA